MNNTDFQWTLLTIVSWVHEAQYIRALLEGSDLECFVPDELTGVINPLLTTMRIRVMVRSKDLERAKALLDAYQSLEAPEEEELDWQQDQTPPANEVSTQPGESGAAKTRCPACLTGKPTAEPQTLWNYLLFIIGIITIVPMRRARDKMRCAQCGKVYSGS